MCDKEFRVESSEAFLKGLNEEEADFLMNRSSMKVCLNCGEFVSASNLTSEGMCNLCSKSGDHLKIRGGSNRARSNLKNDVQFLKEFNR
jgi:hypothetical protein